MLTLFFRVASRHLISYIYSRAHSIHVKRECIWASFFLTPNLIRHVCCTSRPTCGVPVSTWLTFAAKSLLRYIVRFQLSSAYETTYSGFAELLLKDQQTGASGHMHSIRHCLFNLISCCQNDSSKRRVAVSSAAIKAGSLKSIRTKRPSARQLSNEQRNEFTSKICRSKINITTDEGKAAVVS